MTSEYVGLIGFQERDVRVLNLFLLCSRKIWVNYNLKLLICEQLIIENKTEWHKLLEFSAICTVSYSKMSIIKGECMFWFYILKQISVFNIENTEVKVQSIINR
jgi:hypothetical protein